MFIDNFYFCSVVFIAGLAVGSFLNVCIYRLPLGQPVLVLPSHCRRCGMAFSPRYVLVEILTALLFVICFVVLGISVLLIKALVLTAFLLVIAFMDIDHQLIFDKVLLWLAGSGVVINWATGATGTVDMLCGGLGGGILLLILAMARKDGLGGGDIKFTAVLGVWLGWKLTLLTLLLSFLFGGTTGMVLLLLKLKSRQDLIPFGPFLALGAWISLLFGDVLLCYSL